MFIANGDEKYLCLISLTWFEQRYNKKEPIKYINDQFTSMQKWGNERQRKSKFHSGCKKLRLPNIRSCITSWTKFSNKTQSRSVSTPHKHPIKGRFFYTISRGSYGLWASLSATHPCMLYFLALNLLTPMSDRERISPYNINTMSSRQEMRIKKNIN